jgi:hypothetical protein
MYRNARCFAVLLLFLTIRPASAQKLARVDGVGRGTVAVDKGNFDAFTKRYFAGDGAGLRADIITMFHDPVYLDSKGDLLPEVVHRFDFEHNYYSFIFVAKDPTAADPQLVRVLTYPAGFATRFGTSSATDVELGAATVPGIAEIYDVFLSMDKDASIGLQYGYTEVENPLQSQFIAASKVMNFGDIAKAITSQQVLEKTRDRNPEAAKGVDLAARATKTEVVYFAISRVTIPAKRATVTAKATADFGDVAQKKIVTASADVFSDVELRDQVLSPCSVAIAHAADQAVQQNVHSSDDPLDGRDQLKAAVRRAINDTQKLSTCRDELLQPPNEAATLRSLAVQQAIDRFIAIADGTDAKKLQNETGYTNAPLNRFGLGLIAGGLFNTTGDARVKLADDGKVKADPLSGAVSVAALYVHPMPFLSGTPTPSQAERFAFFVGYVATPEPGLALGLGYKLFRGLTINAGYAGMLVDTPTSGVHVGFETDKKRPFDRGVARAAFAGFGYSF